ncbi:hypothetical protein B0H14DRAFT_2628055 [Mycena olivaceomarginata]|nr:hypothetical protein B0H14DRAFT_2628055 [Mycena olivaceomarginata]
MGLAKPENPGEINIARVRVHYDRGSASSCQPEGPHPPEFPTALFDKGDWVSQGKIWRDIPPHVKRVCDQDFVIPAAMASKILPQDGLSVISFLDFTVPLPATTIENPDVSMFVIVQSGIRRFLFLMAANTCGCSR